jgi:hypothetical protein
MTINKKLLLILWTMNSVFLLTELSYASDEADYSAPYVMFENGVLLTVDPTTDHAVNFIYPTLKGSEETAEIDNNLVTPDEKQDSPARE